ncbi:class I SAM-dependent methyltransferase [Dokdonia sp. Hel_I_53]|uniref:class I SAM-dependent methyltransferase n=1 Tax=Dokdonia sp. Hel_I_53 TaxID=1566287 RepID=UPI00119C3A41|nr:class I SAM-dependent methyltransferase [Dokdonia sp. Hel_I_53]TVZ52324.1 methyltransferase family protein [Dokdonia sp. Hel_I_53]
MSSLKDKKCKRPWPTSKAMEQVYDKNLWGGASSTFYSGIGSHDPRLVNPYIKAVSNFLMQFESPITVCDLGCGDFNVGKQLVKFSKKYVAVDIVQKLIDYHKKVFREDDVLFKCLDIAENKLPKGDCALIRQVLQHLSNIEVQSVLSKLKNYKYVILTEHLPEGKFKPNLDIISGQGTRLKKQSGLDVLAAPFNFNITAHEVLLSVKSTDHKGIVVTTLYTL